MLELLLSMSLTLRSRPQAATRQRNTRHETPKKKNIIKDRAKKRLTICFVIKIA